MNYWIKRISHSISSGRFMDELLSHNRHASKGVFKEILPLKSIDDLVNSPLIEVVESEHTNGNISNYELSCICKLIKKYLPTNVFEIGTFDGRTSLHMAMNAPESNIYTLDLPQKDLHKTALRIKTGDRQFIDKRVSGTKFIGTPFAKQITQIYADSASYNYAEFENKMDFVFVDGAHSYEYVVSDTIQALKLLRNGKGIILWHDYGWKEVIQALNEFHLKDPRFRNMVQIADTEFAMLRL